MGIPPHRLTLVTLSVLGALLVGVSCSTEDPVQPPASGSSLPPAEGSEEEPEGDEEGGPTGEVGSSRDNPIPTGETGDAGDWTIEVIGFSPNANEAIHRENNFNEKPPAGSQYTMATLRTTFNGSGSSNPYFQLVWTAVADDGTTYQDNNAVLPNDLVGVGNVPSSASAEGNVSFVVEKSAVDTIVLYIEATDEETFETEGLFFAVR